MEIKKCVICSEEYILKVHNQKICGKECRKELNKKISNKLRDKPEYKERKKEWAKKYYKKNTEYIKEKVRNWKPYSHICRECGMQFNDGRKNSKFCNKKCAAKNSKISRLGQNNPAYRNGFYTGNDRSNRSFRERDFIKVCKIIDERQINDKGYIYCEECGTSNSLRFEHHHLIYRSEKPNHEHLHNIKNIFLCCIKCHNLFHKHKSKRNKIVEERKLNELFGNDVLDK